MALKKWPQRQWLFFFARIGKNHQRQKKSAWGKLVGLDEEKN